MLEAQDQVALVDFLQEEQLIVLDQEVGQAVAQIVGLVVVKVMVKVLDQKEVKVAYLMEMGLDKDLDKVAKEEIMVDLHLKEAQLVLHK